jgi:hypothetical protein
MVDCEKTSLLKSVAQPFEHRSINTPRRCKVKLAIPGQSIGVEDRKRRPVCPESVEFRQFRNVLEFLLSSVAQPGVVDRVQGVVLLRRTDVESCWERYVGEVTCGFGFNLESGCGARSGYRKAVHLSVRTLSSKRTELEKRRVWVAE